MSVDNLVTECNSMNMDAAVIKTIVRPILARHGVMRASLFGSHARGEADESSDIDLLIELPKGTGMFGYMRLKRDLEQALGRTVDLMTFRSVHSVLIH